MSRKPLLTPAQAVEIRCAYADRSARWTVSALAHCYGVSTAMIQRVLNREGPYR